MQQDFQGRIALVTGAASGIGEAVVRQLAARGAQVLAADIDGDAATAVAMSLGDRVMPLRVDVSDPDAVRHMVQAGVERFGALHLAVNNAGISGASLQTADYPLEEWHRVLGVNLHGVFYAMKYEVPAILAAGGGAIVNMASILGSNGWAGSAAYVAAKHALVGMTKSAALEYSAQGLRVNAVGPGFIDTPLLQGMDAQAYAGLVALHPAGRLGTADEVAELTCFLLSDKASFITGSYHLVDGGYSAR
ncbi:SDR family oxidoreductase [Stenotrophomonas sp. STM01]|uniref:SDR family NAD(P)-dependent oxidoreductase n=1 Tax=Stenotrophomonas sp. STM01 TaxID=2769278 RepID=UPI001781BDFB|nr:SDR family NAD(P)-dependent oxidoreductase [Stenotrophomonas sp. STM01]MBD9536195.1 SDR family oxidoreductase [Stenotrophomonas sp. STM01]